MTTTWWSTCFFFTITKYRELAVYRRILVKSSTYDARGAETKDWDQLALLASVIGRNTTCPIKSHVASLVTAKSQKDPFSRPPQRPSLVLPISNPSPPRALHRRRRLRTHLGSSDEHVRLVARHSDADARHLACHRVDPQAWPVLQAPRLCIRCRVPRRDCRRNDRT